MNETVQAYPVELPLPNGRARLVLGSAEAGQPLYEIDGLLVSLDVAIPDDLAHRWFWWGDRLYQRPDGENDPFISIATGTYPPPGVPSERGSCFDIAREMEATRARVTAELAAQKAKKPARKQRSKPATLARPEQIEQTAMELL
jgi:hypothetical protein